LKNIEEKIKTEMMLTTDIYKEHIFGGVWKNK